MLNLLAKSCLIFDMDGVLLLSSDAHSRAFESVFAAHGLAWPGYAAVAGRKTIEVFQRALDTDESSYPAAFAFQLAQEKQELASRYLDEAFPLVAGCPAVLNALAKTHTIALATSSRRENMNRLLQVANLATVFRIAICGDDVTRAKPHPEIYARVLSELAVHAGQCLVIEDSVAGVQAAVAAGIEVCAVAEDKIAAEPLMRAGAVTCVSSIHDLLDSAHLPRHHEVSC
jgi:HAD superfamily hydrolase (TIGR01509 family)